MIIYVIVFFLKETLYTGQIGLKFEEGRMKFYILSIALYGGGTQTLHKVDPKCLYRLNCGTGEGWVRSVGKIG